jgi:hypothetical protein
VRVLEALSKSVLRRGVSEGENKLHKTQVRKVFQQYNAFLEVTNASLPTLILKLT